MKTIKYIFAGLYFFAFVFVFWIIAGLKEAQAQTYTPDQKIEKKDRPFLVYTRQPRYDKPVAEYGEGANWQTRTDIARVIGLLTAADVVIDHPTKGKRVIYNCTEPLRQCVAHEAEVSPDGTQIVFSVGFADTRYVYPVRIRNSPHDIPGSEQFRMKEARLYLYDILTSELKELTNGHIDRAPTFCGVDCIAFTSDRQGHYLPWTWKGEQFGFKSQQVYTARLTDKGLADFKNLTPACFMCLNPYRATDGDFLFSEFWGVGPLEKKSTSPKNLLQISRMGPSGENLRAELARHKGPYIKAVEYLDGIKGGEYTESLKALRLVSEPWKDHYTATNYYRGNGPGNVVEWKKEPGEGVAKLSQVEEAANSSDVLGTGQFIKSTIRLITPYATSQDLRLPRRYTDGTFAGRAGHSQVYPGGYASGWWMYTNWLGYCYTQAIPEITWSKNIGGVPSCKGEIRVAYVPQVTDPFDKKQTEVIACADDKYNCWDAHAITTYREKYGMPIKPMPPALTGTVAKLQIINARRHEVYPLPKLGDKSCPQQGCIEPDYSEKVHSIRLQEVFPWTTPANKQGYAGIKDYQTYPLEKDGSLSVLVDCKKQYLISGVDKEGGVLAQDHKPLFFQCGETVTCIGCHVHDRDTAKAFDPPEKYFAETIAAGKAPAGC